MRNVFLLYMPPGNTEAMVHYEDTIRKKVAFERVARFLARDEGTKLKRIFGSRPIAVWGSRDGSQNRPKFDRMREGDDILIVEGRHIKLMGKVALKTVNPDLSRELWQNLRGDSSAGWDLIYFIANPVEIDVPFEDFCRLFEYAPGWQLRGLTAVAAEKLEAFYERYDDLYSILTRIKAHKPIEQRHIPDPSSGDSAPVDPPADDGTDEPPSGISDHVRMQWLLANLGLKAGQKIWVPASDQARIRNAYQFDQFETEFASGIDLPRSYVENIDVVWKEEYRIDAAFEIENSTAIYSGLLRFADLTIMAPNTTYPLFIVAPNERKNRVREQLRRPSFGRLALRDKVRFLSYERVEEIDQFFAGSDRGLNVEVIESKAEILT